MGLGTTLARRLIKHRREVGRETSEKAGYAPGRSVHQRLVDDQVAFDQIKKAVVEGVLGNGLAAHLDQGLAAG